MRDTLKARHDRLRDEFADYKARLWFALGRPSNIEFIEAVRQLKAENEWLKAEIEKGQTK